VKPCNATGAMPAGPVIRVHSGGGHGRARITNERGVASERFLERNARQFGSILECGQSYLTLEWGRVAAFTRAANAAGIEIIR